MPNNTRPATNADPGDGTLELREGWYALRFARHLAHPVGRVWAALTEPEQLATWLAEAEIDLVEGGAVVLRWRNTNEHGAQIVVQGAITRLLPERLLEIDTDVHGTLCWQLHEEGDGCVLTFTSTVAIPAAWLPLGFAGWHTHVALLADALDGYPVDWAHWSRDRWEARRNVDTGCLEPMQSALAARYQSVF